MEAVKKTIKHLLLKPFPQTFLIHKPFWGAFIFFLLLLTFVVLYRPLEVHQTAFLNLYLTALIYCAIISLSELAVALIISRTNCFSKKGNWIIASELLSIVMILAIIGISVYFAGFMLEAHSNRWNFFHILRFILPFRSDRYNSGYFTIIIEYSICFAPQVFQNYENK